MNTYPTSPVPVAGSTNGLVKEAITTESEGGYTNVRLRYTRGKRPYTLEYPRLKKSDYDILEAFFDSNRGEKFYFTHPDETTQRIVIFTMDKIEAKSLGGGLYSTSIALKEI